MSLIWVDKYKPISSTELIGQARNIARIKSWLKTYEPSRTRPLFIYGPPGIGKTTAAHICCKELGYKVVEFNASDQRNKNIIKDVVSTVCSNSSIDFFGRASETKDAIILDEIDGMAGNEDRGGIGQLIIEMKHTKKPMIFICNDGQHQKLRSLKEKCEVVEFRKPEFDAIRAVVGKIARYERLDLDKINVKNLAESSNFDIRQIINSLSLFKNGVSDQISKTTRLNAFESTKRVLTESNLTLDEKFECFFADYNIMPLFMFENYVKNSDLNATSKAANSLCFSDLAEKEIRSNQNWSLLNTQALFSTAIPSTILKRKNFGAVSFPQFLGKLSNANKRLRLNQELNSHMCLSLRGGLDPDYLEVMRARLSTPLLKRGVKGIEEVIDFMHSYSLMRSDIDSLMELASWSFSPDPFTKLDSKTKTAFTLACKKRSIAMPYFSDESVKKKKVFNMIGGDNEDGDELADEDEEEDEQPVMKPKRVIKDAKKPAKEPKEPKKASATGNANGASKEAKPAAKPAAPATKEVRKSSDEPVIVQEKKVEKRPLNGEGIAKYFISKKQKSAS